MESKLSGRDDSVSSVERAGTRSLGLQLLSAEVQQSNEFEMAISGLVDQGIGALVILPDPMIAANFGWISILAARNRLSSISTQREFVEYGGLLAYGPVVTDMSKRAATYVSKILNGVRPEDLPVDQPTRFQLILNSKTANLLGLPIPASILVRADEVIE